MNPFLADVAFPPPPTSQNWSFVKSDHFKRAIYCNQCQGEIYVPNGRTSLQNHMIVMHPEIAHRMIANNKVNVKPDASVVVEFQCPVCHVSLRSDSTVNAQAAVGKHIYECAMQKARNQ